MTYAIYHQNIFPICGNLTKYRTIHDVKFGVNTVKNNTAYWAQI